MEAYILTKGQISAIIDYGISIGSSYGGGPGTRFYTREEGVVKIREDALADKVVEEIGAGNIVLDELDIAKLDSPCRFIPKDSIVGFTQVNGNLQGVFVKE